MDIGGLDDGIHCLRELTQDDGLSICRRRGRIGFVCQGLWITELVWAPKTDSGIDLGSRMGENCGRLMEKDTKRRACWPHELQQCPIAMLWKAKNANVNNSRRLPHAPIMSDITSHRTTTDMPCECARRWRCVTGISSSVSHEPGPGLLLMKMLVLLVRSNLREFFSTSTWSPIYYLNKATHIIHIFQTTHSSIPPPLYLFLPTHNSSTS